MRIVTIPSSRPHRGQQAFGGEKTGKGRLFGMCPCQSRRSESSESSGRENSNMTNESLQAWKCEVVHDHRRLAAYMMRGKTSHYYTFYNEKGCSQKTVLREVEWKQWLWTRPQVGKKPQVESMCMFMWISQAESVSVCVYVCARAVCLWVTLWMSLMWCLVPRLVPF